MSKLEGKEVLGKNDKFDLEERLINFAVRIIRAAESLPKIVVGKHIGGQIIRSGTSPAANYGEAQGAESRSDFIHKIKICLKELRETKNIVTRSLNRNTEKRETKAGANPAPAFSCLYYGAAVYFFRFFLPIPANPINPTPRRSMVEGTGTGEPVCW